MATAKTLEDDVMVMEIAQGTEGRERSTYQAGMEDDPEGESLVTW